MLKRLVVGFALANLIFIGCDTEKGKTDVEKFQGRWQLFVVESKADSISDWKPREDHYKNRFGFIIYDGLGGMGVHHVTENYSTYIIEGKGGLDSLTNNDLRHLANNFVYFGHYKVDPSNKVIEHHIESSNMPSMWNTMASRIYEFNGDTLTLSPMTPSYPKTRIRWVRVDDFLIENH